MPIDSTKVQEAAEHFAIAGISEIAEVNYAIKDFGVPWDTAIDAAIRTTDGKHYSVWFLSDGSVGTIKNEQGEIIYFYVPIE